MISFFFTFLISILIISLISFIIPFLSYFLIIKIPDKEKSSVYECGFIPIKNLGQPFSVRFFIIAILFLVFDLEIIILFPWSISYLWLTNTGILVTLMFFLILAMGLFYEWIKGGLEWE